MSGVRQAGREKYGAIAQSVTAGAANCVTGAMEEQEYVPKLTAGCGPGCCA